MNKPRSQLLRTFNFYLAFFAMTLVSGSAIAQAPETSYAGSIVYTKGGVVAIDVNGESRPLARRANIFIGDTVYTAAESSVQLSMSDSAQIVLGESTVFEISEYTYQDNANDWIILNLVEGGFRTVTGKVAKGNYRAEVNGFSNIGIRGTEYEARIIDTNRLVVGLYDGGVTLSNFGGALDLGLGADYDFAEVSNMFLAPVGIDVIPAGLDELALVAALQLPEAVEQGQDAAVVAGTLDSLNANDNLLANINSTDIASSGVAGDQSVDVGALAANATDTASVTGQADTVASLDTFRSSTFGSVRRLARSLDTNLADGAAQDISTLTADVEFVTDGTVLALPELLDAETDVASDLLDIAGQATVALTEVDIPLQEISLASVITNTVQELPIDDPTALVASVDSLDPAPVVGAATEVAGSVVQQAGDLVSVDPTTGSAPSVIDPVASTDPANPPPAVDPVADLVDAVDTIVPTVIDAAGDLVADAAGDTTSAGDTTTADETVEETVDTVADAADDTGVSVLELVEEVVETATETVADGVETAATTETPVEEVVEETVATTETPVEEPVVETVEEVVEETVATTETPVEEPVVETVEEVVEELPVGGESLLVMKQAPVSAAKQLARSQNWGAWNAPVPEHIAQRLTISAGDYSVDLTPTAVANLTGSYHYSDVVGFEGHGSAGSVSDVQAGFDVDFNTGVIANGMLSVAVEESQNWLLGFDGVIDQGVVDLNSLGGTLIDFTQLDASSPIHGDLSGAFTGAQGESFIGGFELLDLNNAQNIVEGIYTVDR